MDIHSEYARLKTLASTVEGWQTIEDLWMIALNHEKREGRWYKTDSRGGDEVCGFALDPVSKDFEIGPRGRYHYLAKLELEGRLTDNASNVAEYENIQGRIIDGRLMHVTGWQFPFIQLSGFTGISEELEHAEEILLQLGLGLPLTGILWTHATENKKPETPLL